MTSSLDKPLRELIRLARQQHAKGAGTVLDVLLRQQPQHAATLMQQLRDEAGVAAFMHPEELEFIPMGAVTNQSAQSSIVMFGSENQLYLGMADPWDEAVFMQASKRLGQPVLPAAVTTAVLHEAPVYS